MNKKLLIWIVYVIALVSIANAISVDDVLNSYNMSYSNGDVSVNGYDVSGFDTGGNPQFDLLIVNASINTAADTYQLIGELTENNNLVQAIELTQTYGAGINQAQFNFSAKALDSSNYNFTLKIYQDGLIFREKNFAFTINPANYETREINITSISAAPLNNVSDARNDFFILNLTLDSTVADTANIYAYISAGTNKIYHKKATPVAIGTQTVSIAFDSKDIRSKRLNNTFLLKKIKIKLTDVTYNYHYNTTLGNFNKINFDPKKTVITDSFNEYTINSSGKIDELYINATIEVNQTATYNLKSALYDFYGNFIYDIDKNVSLTLGIDSVKLILNYTDVYASKLNGPYSVGYMKLLLDDEQIDYAPNPYSTRHYKYTDFNTIPLPELKINSIELRNQSLNYTTANVTIQNTGNAPAFNVKVTLFNNRTDEIQEHTIERIDALTSYDALIHRTNITETSYIRSYVDIQNTIEEINDSNNDFELSLLPDLTAPIMTITYPTNNTNLTYTTTQTQLNITTDENAYCRYSTNALFNFNDGTLFDITNSLTHSADYSVSEGNIYTLYYRCNDSSNNIANAIEHKFGVTPDSIPIVTVINSSTTGLEDYTVYFNATAIGDYPINYSWDFNNNGSYESFLQNTSYTFSAGFFQVNLTATDVDGDKAYLIIDVNILGDFVPVCNIIATPVSGLAPLSVELNATITSGNAPFNYNWSFTNNGIWDSLIQNTSYIYPQGNHTVNLTVEDSDGDICSKLFNITANADLVATANLTANITTGIEPLCVLFNSTGSGNLPIAYSLDYDNNGVSDTTNQIYSHCYNAGSHVANLTVTDFDGDKAYSIVNINVQTDIIPNPVISPNTTTGLAPLDVQFTSTSNGNAPLIYQWSFTNNGTIDSTLQNPAYTFSAGIHTVNLTVIDNDGDVNSTTVIITSINNLVPSVLAIANTTLGLSPLAVQFTGNSIGGNTPITYSWDIDNNGVTDYATQNTSHIYTAGVYTANFTACDAQLDCDSDTIIINSTNNLVVVNVTASTYSGYTSLDVDFTSNILSGDSPYTYSWNFGDLGSSIQANPSHTYTSGGIYAAVLTVTDFNGDVNTSQVIINVTTDIFPNPVITPNITSGLEPLGVQFMSTSNGNAPLIYQWSFTNNGTIDSTLQNPVYAFPAGIHTVNLTVIDNNGDINSTTVVITSIDDLTPTAFANANVTLGITSLDVLLSGTYISGDAPFTFSWDIDNNGVTDYATQNAEHTYTTGIYTANFTVCDAQSDCDSDIVVINVSANNLVVVNVTASTYSGYTSLDVDFTSNVLSGDSPYIYSWNFGDLGSSTQANPSHTYTNGGIYAAVLTVTDFNGDVNTSQVIINVTTDIFPNPVITPNITSGLEPLDVQFTSTSNGNAPLIYQWSFTNNGTIDSTLQNPVYAFPAGIHTVNLTVIDNNGDINSTTVIITSIDDLTPTAFANANVNLGVTPLSVLLSGTYLSGNAPFTFSWDIDNNGISDYTTQNAEHTYTTGSYTANFTVCDAQSDCNSDTVAINVNPNSLVVVNITASTYSGSALLAVNFNSNVLSGDSPYTYSWNFGDSGTSTQANPSHSYTSGGIYNAVLTVTDFNGDINTSQVAINVTQNTRPSVVIKAVPNPGSSPLSVSLTSIITGGNAPFTYEWDFNNDGIIDSTLANVTHIYSTGVWHTSLKVTDSVGYTRGNFVNIISEEENTATYTIKAITRDFNNPSLKINPSVIVINGVIKDATPYAWFNVDGGAVLAITYGAAGYENNNYQLFLDNGLSSCDGKSICNLKSTTDKGYIFSTQCTYSATYNDYGCYVMNNGQAKKFFYKPSENRVTIAGYLKNT